MPPPKQKPVAATFFPGSRRRSSVTPAFMSATNREAGRTRARPSPRTRPRTTSCRPPPRAGRSRGRSSGLGEAARDRADRVVEPAVLVDHQHTAARRRAEAQAPISLRPPGARNVMSRVWRRQPPPPPRRHCRPPRPAARVSAFALPARLLPEGSGRGTAQAENPSRRRASRRETRPSAWSSATSSARYRWISVTVGPPRTFAAWLSSRQAR